LKPVQVALAGAALVALDKGTALALNLCMLLLTAALIAVDRADPGLAKTTTQFFDPAVEIIQRWMPLFYTPAIVMMSVVGQKIVAGEAVRLLALVGK
jgi:hypothetical protein